MKEDINPDRIPQHIAVIMDGNGRWAKQKGAARIFGHKNAIKAVRETVEGCVELGVSFLTLYAFSTENWNRPKEEVNALMELLIGTIIDELKTLTKNGIKLQTIGDTAALPEKCRNQLLEAIEQTKHHNKMTLILALSYSGRWELVHAIKGISEDIKTGKIASDVISEELVSAYLQTAQYPDPELMIRTSGELRISNFLLWQIAYSELYFTEVLWPDFRREHLHEAVLDYQKRERRFGKTSEQLNIN